MTLEALSTLSPRQTRWLAAGTLVLVAAVYAAGLGTYFVGDDFPWLTHAVKMRHDFLGALAERYTWGGSCLLFYADLKLWGTEPLGYDLTDLVLHLANTALVGFLGWLLTRSQAVALLAALLWGTSAAGAEAVLWKTGRGHSLLLLLLLLAVTQFLRWNETGRKRRLVAAGAAAVAAHFTLFSGVMLVPLLAAHRTLYGSRQGGWWRLLRAFIPFAAITAAYLVLYGRVSTTLPASAYYRPGWHLLPAFGAYVAHLFSLAPDLLPRSVGAGLAATATGWLGLAAFGAAFVLVRSRTVRFGLAWVGLTILPYLPVPVDSGFQPSRYCYVPMVGVALVLGFALVKALEYAATNRRLRRVVPALVTTAVVVLVVGNARVVRSFAQDLGKIGQAHMELVNVTAPKLPHFPPGRLVVLENRSDVNVPVLLARQMQLPHGLYVRGHAPWKLVYVEDLLTVAVQDRRPGTLFVVVDAAEAAPELAAGRANLAVFTNQGLGVGNATPVEQLLPRLTNRDQHSAVTALRIERLPRGGW